MNKEEIKALRGILDLSQEKFAALVGVTRGTVNSWEKGDNKPSPLALERLLDEQQRAQV